MRIEVGRDGERVLVVLLRGVRSDAGQEFFAGWRCGFTRATAEHLVSIGAARWAEQPAEAPALAAPRSASEAVGAGVALVGAPPVSTGEAPPESVDGAEPPKPVTTRRRK